MSYQLKISSNEAGPWSAASGKNRISFTIPGVGSTTLPDGYLQFQGTVTNTGGNNYTGELQLRTANEYRYSGACAFVRHAWVESSNLGPIESKRFANLINEAILAYQVSQERQYGQDYSGYRTVWVMDNEFNIRLQLSDLLEMAKSAQVLNLGWTGDLTITLELDTELECFHYTNKPDVVTVPLVDQMGVPGGTVDRLQVNINPLDKNMTGLVKNQMYLLNWNDSVSGVQSQVVTVTSVLRNVATPTDCDVTIDPPMPTGGNPVDLTGISLDHLPAAYQINGYEFSKIDLVLYKPIGVEGPKKLEFMEWHVESDNQPNNETYVKQWNLEPGTTSAILLTPEINPTRGLVAKDTELQYYRNTLNGLDLVDRNIEKRSALYKDRLLNNLPGCVNLSQPTLQGSKMTIVERIPVNGAMNTLQTMIKFNPAPLAKPSYLFKHVPKVIN